MYSVSVACLIQPFSGPIVLQWHVQCFSILHSVSVTLYIFLHGQKPCIVFEWPYVVLTGLIQCFSSPI